jgi:thioredoxin 1
LLLALLGRKSLRKVAVMHSAGIEQVGSITSREDFYEKLGSSRDGKKSGCSDGDLFCIKFYASWCKSCKAIAPKYKALADEYTGQAHFYEIQFSTTKEMKDLFTELNVTKTPSVQFYRGEKGRLSTVVCGPKRWTDVEKHLDMYLNDNNDELLECVLDGDLTECTDVSTL